MKRKNIFPMTLSELEALPTKRLLGRLACLHRCEQSLALSDLTPQNYQPSSAIEFKDSPEWLTEYKKLKEVLAWREHVSRGAAESRRQNARGKVVPLKVGKRAKL